MLAGMRGLAQQASNQGVSSRSQSPQRCFYTLSATGTDYLGI